MLEPAFPEAGPSRSHSHDRPSLFELLAEEQLKDLYHPVIRYVLSYLAQRYPRHLIRLLHRHEEVYALILLLLERHHLKKHNASVSEHFYQLHLVPYQRVPTPRLTALEGPRRSRLTKRQRWGLLVFLVGLPYLRIKAQRYFEDLRRSEEMTSDSSLTRRQRMFKLLYPYINLGLDLSLLGYDIAYLFDKTDSYRPWHAWLGIRVERKGPDDMPTPSTGLLSRLPPLLPPLLLLLKLSQWWYSPSSPRSLPVPRTLTTNHNLIPPPKPLPILPTADIYPPLSSFSPDDDEVDVKGGGYTISTEDYGKCPLCSRKWQNPAILESGWVVCWRCGWDAIQGEEGEKDGIGKCPITGVEVSRTDLRRVLL